MALTPPRTRSPQIYDDWARSIPTDETYLVVAHDYLDRHEAGFQRSWIKHGPGWSGLAETDAERADRAQRIAQGFHDLGWTNRDLMNFQNQSDSEQREAARMLARARVTRRDFGPLSDEESARYYHG